MAHKNLIDGTAYEIDGGKAMVDGTVYEIDHGTTLVDGTAYEVGFAKPMAKVTIVEATGYQSGLCELIVDGITYTSAATFEVPIGTEIYFKAKGGDNSYSQINVNGNTVAQGSGDRDKGFKDCSYTHTITCNLFVKFSRNKDGGIITITEIPEGHALVNITGSGSIRVMGKICAVTVDGVDYTSATTLAVPVGTVASCTVSTMTTHQLYKGWVKINGNTVLTASGLDETYDYTVSGNVTINMSTERNSDKDTNGYITITET